LLGTEKHLSSSKQKLKVMTKTIIDHINKYILTSEDSDNLKEYFKSLDDDDLPNVEGKTVHETINLISPEGFEEETKSHIINCLISDYINY
jgi:hypothetical protein